MKIIQNILNWFRNIRAQNWIASICIAIVGARMINPSIAYDAESRNLILIAMACILVPDLARLMARIKKLKLGNNEIELGEALDDLAKKTEKAEEHLYEDKATPFMRNITVISPNVNRYLKDPRGGLISVAVDIEERVKDLVRTHNLDTDRRYISPMHGVDILSKKGIVVSDLPMLMRDFWIVRNRAFHSSDIKLAEQDIYRLVDLGVRILDLLSVTKDG